MLYIFFCYIKLVCSFLQERYKAILDERLPTTGEQHEPLEWWIEAVGPLKKNRILGEPRIAASDLLYGSDNHTINTSPQSTCGRCLSDDLFFKVVKETLQAASSSNVFQETSMSREQVETLAEGVVGGNTLHSETSIDKEKKDEVTRLVITTLESIYSSIHRSLKVIVI